VFFDEIKAVGKRKDLRVLCFASSTVKKHIVKNGWAKKSEVAKALCTKYPELKVYLTQDRGWEDLQEYFNVILPIKQSYEFVALFYPIFRNITIAQNQHFPWILIIVKPTNLSHELR